MRSTNEENDLLYIPRFRSNRLQNSTRYQGVKIWNSIPHSIRLLSPISFNVKLKNFFVESYKSWNLGFQPNLLNYFNNITHTLSHVFLYYIYLLS